MTQLSDKQRQAIELALAPWNRFARDREIHLNGDRWASCSCDRQRDRILAMTPMLQFQEAFQIRIEVSKGINSYHLRLVN